MLPVERCDEIARLIDDALSELPEAAAPALAVREPEHATGAVHATDGRWWQRPSEPDGGDGVTEAAVGEV